MKNKRKTFQGSDTDKAIAQVGSSKTEELKTAEPIAENGEVKHNEEKPHKRLSKNKKHENENTPVAAQKTAPLNKPHMLFR